MQACWLLLVTWLWSQAPADPQVIILVFDAPTGTSAGLWLGDAPSVPSDVLHEAKGEVWATIDSVGGNSPSAGDAAGYTRGKDAAVAALLAHLEPQAMKTNVAAWVGEAGVATFESQNAAGIVLHYQSPIVVLGTDLPRSWVHDLGRQLGAVQQDPLDLLLAAAQMVGERWPQRHGPRSALLVAHGASRARERIAVERGAVARRLLAQHLWHLARVEVPFLLDRARVSCATEVEACPAASRAVLHAAHRVLQVHPNDHEVRDAVSEAEDLVPVLNGG